MDDIKLKLLNMLIQCLDDDNTIHHDVTVKDIAYSTIVSMGKDTAEPLTNYLEENKGLHNRDINQEVANILLDICMIYKDDTPLNVFMEAVTGSSEFRLEAIRAIGYIGNENSYKSILKIIKNNDENSLYRSNAVSSFGNLYPKYGNNKDLLLLIDLMDSLQYKEEDEKDPFIKLIKQENKDIIILKNNTINVVNNIYKESYITIGEFIERREETEE